LDDSAATLSHTALFSRTSFYTRGWRGWPWLVCDAHLTHNRTRECGTSANAPLVFPL